MEKVPFYKLYITTTEGKKYFAFTWRGSDIIKAMQRCEREAKEFGFQVKEISYLKIA